MAHEPSERLAAYLPSSTESSVPPRIFTDIEIQTVASLLEDCEASWSQVPRTYIILRTIGRLNLLNELLQVGFNDHWFPVEASALPQFLQPSTRAAIANVQSIILTKSVDIEKGENGRHWHFAKDEPKPFKSVGLLGKGGFSQVDMIRSTISLKKYALKRIRRRRVFGKNAKEAVDPFITEMRLLKTLRHQHIVEYVGSFTDPSYLGLIMAPIAEMNLAQYLERISAQPDHLQYLHLTTLRSFSGCLASALQYLHDQSVRHRDIKPQNILIDGSNVLFTDFGLSKDYSRGVGSTTSGITTMTRRCAAPKVILGDSRNSSADIWSLGCVFLEMVVVLKGNSVSFLKDCLLDNGSKEPHAHSNLEAVTRLLTELEVAGMAEDNTLLTITRRMLTNDRFSCPKAAEVFSVLTCSADGECSSPFCGICCQEDEVSDSHNSLVDDADMLFTVKPVRNHFAKNQDSGASTNHCNESSTADRSGENASLRDSWYDFASQRSWNHPDHLLPKALERHKRLEADRMETSQITNEDRAHRAAKRQYTAMHTGAVPDAPTTSNSENRYPSGTGTRVYHYPESGIDISKGGRSPVVVAPSDSSTAATVSNTTHRQAPEDESDADIIRRCRPGTLRSSKSVSWRQERRGRR